MECSNASHDDEMLYHRSNYTSQQTCLKLNSEFPGFFQEVEERELATFNYVSELEINQIPWGKERNLCSLRLLLYAKS